MPAILGLLVWAGLFMRNQQLRASVSGEVRAS